MNALKALFILKRRTSPGKSHSLIYLATETETPAKFNSFLRKLAPEFVTTRYPDVAYGTPYELYNDEMVTEILKKSKEVILWINSQMKT